MTTAIKIFATKQIQPAITRDSLKDSGGIGPDCAAPLCIRWNKVFKGFQRVNPNYVTSPPDFISSEDEYECQNQL